MNNKRYNLPTQAARRTGGFTLIEMLMIIGIILILSSILVPSLIAARRVAKTAQTRATIHLLDGACQMYMHEMADILSAAAPTSPLYPPSKPGTMNGVTMQGRHLLVECLTGYLNKAGDGAEGPGFRLTGGKKLYGPYNGAENVATVVDSTNNLPVFVDSFGQPILYYCGPTFDTGHNTGTGFPTDATYVNNPATNKPYINTFWIISPGPDGEFWDPAVSGMTNDDITNFNR
ncbi:MAG: hypothetical protein EHM48_01060 [Planctomycetaceae bacterium]|nr:MAG: hypothetical protein EHM48_01060 [Planctomycetaceae bacterium]